MPMKPRLTALILASCLPLAACGPGAVPEAAREAAPEAPPVPAQPAEASASDADAAVARPALAVTLLDGSAWDIAAQRGRWVVVNFWATWCKPCLKEIPDLSALHDAREDVEVIGLAYEEIAVADMQAFLQKYPASYPIAIVDVYAPPADFDTPRGLPMTWLIAPDGRVAEKFLGPVTSDDLTRAIEAAATPG